MNDWRIGSLFSGIGGLELGLERAGLGRTAWQVEQDPFALSILAKHWPEAERFTDVREVGKHNLQPVEVICGGFPCQDVSTANIHGKGIEGERSGLWSEFARIIGEIQPRFVVIENVVALRKRGLEVVLKDLAAIGYDAEWHCIRASEVGAPHLRDRIYIVAYPSGQPNAQTNQAPGSKRGKRDSRDHDGGRCRSSFPRVDWGIPEPRVGGVDYGLPNRVDRMKCLGNAVVPQVPEALGRLIATVAKRQAVDGAKEPIE